MTLPTPAAKNNNIPVVFACGADFLPYAGVAAASLLQHTQKNCFYDIFILHGQPISAEIQKQFAALTTPLANAQIRFIDVAPFLTAWQGKMLVRENMSQANYYRLLIPQIFAHFDKVIYLDSDVLLCRDIALLYEQKLNPGTMLGAVQDALAFSPTPKQQDFVKKHCRLLGLKSPLEYFNSGVLLWDLKAFRTQNLQDKLQQCMQKWARSPHMDQDILNAAFYQHTTLLPMSFNLFAQPPVLPGLNLPPAWADYINRRAQAMQAPCIIHYAGVQKPWSYPRMPYADGWLKTAKDSPFAKDILQLAKIYARTMRKNYRLRWLYWFLQWVYRVQNRLQNGRGNAAQKAFALQERIHTCTLWKKYTKR